MRKKTTFRNLKNGALLTIVLQIVYTLPTSQKVNGINRDSNKSTK